MMAYDCSDVGTEGRATFFAVVVVVDVRDKRRSDATSAKILADRVRMSNEKRMFKETVIRCIVVKIYPKQL